MQSERGAIVSEVAQWEREDRRAVSDLSRETTGCAIADLMEELRAGYRDLSEDTEYLDGLERDVKENADDFLGPSTPQAGTQLPSGLERASDAARIRRYPVNPIVDNGALPCAPAMSETNP